eukprot:2531316-Rhodomonas_salina.2
MQEYPDTPPGYPGTGELSAWNSHPAKHLCVYDSGNVDTKGVSTLVCSYATLSVYRGPRAGTVPVLAVVAVPLGTIL